MRLPLVETGMEKHQFDFFVENHLPPSGGMQLYILVDLPVVALVHYAEFAVVNSVALGEECFADKAYNASADVQTDAFVTHDSVVCVVPVVEAFAALVTHDPVVCVVPVAEAFAALDALAAGAFADPDAASFAHAVAWPVPIVNSVDVQVEPFVSPAVEHMMSDSSVVPLDVHAVEKTGSLATRAVVELALSAVHPEASLPSVALNEQQELQPALVWK
ncbi:hypothetical protein ACFX13_022006 [Malus domestica]